MLVPSLPHEILHLLSLLVYSLPGRATPVGGGDEVRNVSVNLIQALQLAKQKNAAIVGIIGRDGGYTKTVADACVIIPTVNASHVTPHTESFHSVICHLLVSHPALKQAETKWESVK